MFQPLQRFKNPFVAGGFEPPAAGTARNFVVVPYSIPRRCAATYFPETNVLVPVRSVAEKSNTPVSKSVVISIRPASSAKVDKP